MHSSPGARVHALKLLQGCWSLQVSLESYHFKSKGENVSAAAGAARRSLSRYIADTKSLDDDAAIAAENFTDPNSAFLTRAVFGRACQKFRAGQMSSTFVTDLDYQDEFLQGTYRKCVES